MTCAEAKKRPQDMLADVEVLNIGHHVTEALG